MKVPRNLSSERLIQLLANFGYETTRQTGSHIRLTTQENGQHHLTIPAHDPLKIGTLNSILRTEVSAAMELADTNESGLKLAMLSVLAGLKVPSLLGFRQPTAQIFTAYTTDLYQFDRAYRHFIVASDKAKPILREQKLIEEIENIYVHWFLDKRTRRITNNRFKFKLMQVQAVAGRWRSRRVTVGLYDRSGEAITSLNSRLIRSVKSNRVARRRSLLPVAKN